MMLWRRVTKFDQRARALADRHYSRQRIGSPQFMPPGRTIVLLTLDEHALWGVALNMAPTGEQRWRCTIFRNEGPELSSDLVREATRRTFELWRHRYGGLPSVPLTTEIDPDLVRRKRDVGRCFRRAGWTFVRIVQRAKRRRRHVVLAAPGETWRLRDRPSDAEVMGVTDAVQPPERGRP
jgi:hypothetical protein